MDSRLILYYIILISIFIPPYYLVSIGVYGLLIPYSLIVFLLGCACFESLAETTIELHRGLINRLYPYEYCVDDYLTFNNKFFKKYSYFLERDLSYFSAIITERNLVVLGNKIFPTYRVEICRGKSKHNSYTSTTWMKEWEIKRYATRASKVFMIEKWD